MKPHFDGESPSLLLHAAMTAVVVFLHGGDVLVNENTFSRLVSLSSILRELLWREPFSRSLERELLLLIGYLSVAVSKLTGKGQP